MTIKTIARALWVCVLMILAASMAANPIAETSLEIRGLTLEVTDTQIDLNLGSPGVVQTKFGGLTNDEAPRVEGLVAEGELVGPGLLEPLTLRTAPGHAFSVPGLAPVGDYYLQNIRLTSNGQYLSPAVPSTVHIRVSDTLKTEVKVRQLTPEELRARGIVVDARNFDVYEYTFTFYLDDGTAVEIPFPVIIDPRTREVFPVVAEMPYRLPSEGSVTPPRWTPPTTVAFDLGVEPGELPPPSSPTPGAPAPSRPSIPAALVIPSNLAVLHQFFGVAIVVTNGAPDGSEVVLEEVGATIRTPNQLRVVKSEPSVAFGQAVPIQGPDGLNFLVAQAQGQAEWTVEGLAAGTYTVDVDVRATMKSPGQPDLALKGTKSASMVIHDPRFSVTFSVPSTVFPTLDPQSDANAFSAYAFVTNMSSQRQTISTSSGLSACGPTLSGLCLAGPSPDVDGVTLDPGELLAMEYRLKSKDGGTVFASSTSGGGGALGLSFEVRNGENLNPSTLIMPWYARYLDQAFVNAQLELLGRGYAIATTPTTTSTSKYPRVIKTDVFRRAVDIARAGQRVFLTTDETDLERSREGARFAYSNLALDLLGARDGRRGSGEPVAGGSAIAEWDELRRTDLAGRNGGSALARQIETTFAAGDDAATIFERFIEANSHRSDFVAAMVHGGSARIRFETAAGYTVGANDAGAHEYTRQVPFADVHALTLPDSTRAELGLIGRLTTEMTLVLEATGPFDLDLVYPGGADGAPLRITHSFTDTAPHTFRLRIVNGVALVDSQSGDPTPITQGSEVVPPALSILAARQDLYLDSEGHKVSILFNRPVGTVDDMRDVFEGSVRFVNGGFAYAGPRPISAAALQEDGRVVNATFDHGLHVNVSGRAGCSYEIEMVGRVRDPLSGIDLTGLPVPAPRIDNDREAAVILGRVLGGDGQPIPGADVILWAGPPQYDRSADASADASAGAFLFEYVPIEPGNFTLEGITLEGKSTSFAGSVRFDGQVYPLDLQFLGRGGARGFVRYADTNEPVAGATVVVSNRLFGGFRTATTDAAGRYEVSDLPVGTTTFVARDGDGNIVYATNEIAIPGQVLEQDLLIPRRAHPGFGTIRGSVRRSDNPALGVPGAHVGVYSQGYGLIDGYTDAAGRFEFGNVPAGSVTVLAEEWTVAWQSAALDFELGADQVKDVSLTLMMRGGGQAFVSVEGTVTKSATGATPVPVPGALVLIDGLQVVTADANGKYTYESVPASFSGRRIRAHDPATGRQAEDSLPTLVSPGPNSKPLHINTDTGTGTGTIRVLVLDATGQPVGTSECDVVAVGIGSVGDTTQTGVFELRGVAVGRAVQLAAYSTSSDGLLGDQYVTTLATIGFADQVLSVTMRMPGEGSVNVSLVSDGVRQIGDVRMRYRVWDSTYETIEYRERVLQTAEGGLAGYARFEKVPVGPAFDVVADLAAQGNASAERRLEYHGQLLNIDLQLGTRASVSGRVLAFDGITPVAGATVNIIDGLQQSPARATTIDGSFTFADVAPDTSFQLIADWTANGVNRKGTAYGRTPAYGGKVEDVIVTLMRRADVNVKVVWADQQVHPETGNLVPDQTPGDYSDNAPISRASFWLSELEFPRREFGTPSNPLKGDTEGNFLVPNVMEGPFRVNAVSGDFSGHITSAVTLDGPPDVSVIVPVGSEGFGELEVSVLDPENGFAGVPSAEVRLFRNGGAFDVASTDATGRATFGFVPGSGAYRVQAFSKALGRSGSADLSGSVMPNGRVFLDVLLEVSGTVEGSLTDAAASGVGVVGAHVDLDGSGYRTRATTGTAGAFVFEGIREGTFTLRARDPLSNRKTSAAGQITRLVQNAHVDLELPPWSTMRLRVWLPDDAGQQSSNLASLVRAEVSQLCYGFPARCDELYSSEGNDFLFDRLLEGDYKVAIQELGGAGRSVAIDGQIGEGQSIVRDVTLPAFGSVRVRVIEKATGAPMKDVKVSVYNTTKSFVAYTDATGIVSAHGFEVTKNASANATTLNGLLSGRATGLVSSASTPLDLTIEMESLASVAGFVEAETGGPSIGTAVTVGGTSTITSGDGRFELGGFKTGTGLTINYFGPDGTIGASQSFTPTQPGVNEAPPVVLDSTRPLILSIVPDNGAIEVPRDASIDVEFSEPISPAFLTADSFRLAKIGSSVATPVRFETSSTETGHYVVSVIPLQDLASHQLYTFVVSGSVADLTGHTLGQNRGIGFATTDQSVPQVIAIRPDLNKPVPTNSALQIDFNEALMAEDWPEPGQEPAPGQIGLMKLVRIDSDNILHAAGGNYSLDPDTQRTLTFAPDELFENSRYRLEVSGVRDTKDNTVPDTLSFAFSTVDTVDPVVTILAPTPGEPLVSGLFYTTQLDIRNDDTASSPATDIERVEYFHRIDGGDWVLTRIVSRSGANPGFGYSFSVPAAAATLGLRVVAWDTSGRDSDPAEASYAVVADAAPASVAITPTAAGEVVTGVYPGTAVSASLTFDESGLSATYQIVAVATKDGATLFTATPKSGELLRAQGAAWPDVTYSFTLPKTLLAGAVVNVSAVITDSSGLTGTGSAAITVLEDVRPPVVTGVALPQPGTNFTDSGRVDVIATATDAEVGVASMRVHLDGREESLTFDPSKNEFTGSITAPDVSGTEPVPFDLWVEAVDYAGNVSEPVLIPITVTPVFDPTAPVISSVCGTDGVMLPPGLESFTYTVDVQPGTTPISLVRILVNGTEAPHSVIGSRYSTTISTVGATPGDTISVRVEALTAGTGFAYASLSIPIVDAIDMFEGYETGERTIEPDDSRFENRSILVNGGTLTIKGPHSFANVIVLGGGEITAADMIPLEVIAGNVYVACGSAMNVDKLASAPAPHDFAGGSHGGFGAYAVRQTYGSAVWPRSFGSAGGVNPSYPQRRQNNGGGVVDLFAERLVLDGTIRANGDGSSVDAGGGSGGSVLLQLSDFSVGRGASISANGATGQGSFKGGGGGRIAIHSQGRVQSDLLFLSAQGHGSTTGVVGDGSGSAGTVYVREGGDEHLVIDNKGVRSSLSPSLPVVGMVSVSSVNWPEITISPSVPSWVQGSRIECSQNESVVGDWRILSRPTSQTLVLEGDAPTGSLVGATCRGYWRFDRVIARNGGRYIIAGDVEMRRFEGTADAWVEVGDIVADDLEVAGVARSRGGVVASTVTVENGGRFEPSSRVSANKLTVAGGGVLSHMATPESGLDWPKLDLAISGHVQVDGDIDVSGKGFRGTVSSRGRTWPNSTAGGSYLGAGGSHGGRASEQSGFTYGSVSYPAQAGSAGSMPQNNVNHQLQSCSGESCSGGGGVVVIDASTVTVNGRILSNGTAGQGQGGGSGGSILIRTERLNGTGVVEANGALSTYGSTTSGGGGRVALESPEITVTQVRALRGGNYEAAGTVVRRSSASDLGTLTIDNTGRTPQYDTALPSLGYGSALTGSVNHTLATARSSTPGYFVGHWVEVRDAGGAAKGLWQITAIDGGVLTLSTDASIVEGDRWQGVYRFDEVQLIGGAIVRSVDPILAPGYERPSAAVTLSASEVLAGAKLDATVTASDTQGLTQVVLHASGDIVAGQSPQTRTVTGTQSVQAFQVATAPVSAPGRIEVWTDVYDEIGSLTSSVPLTVSVLPDTTKPVISSVTFAPDRTRYLPGELVRISVDVGDDVAVSQVSLLVDGVAVGSDTTAPFVVDWTTPSSPGVLSLVLEARDPSANVESTAPRQAEIAPEITIGTVASNFPVTQSGHSNFRSRRLYNEGRHLIVTGAYSGESFGHTDRVVVLDLTNPLQPVYRQTLQGSGDIYDVAIHEGWAFVASYNDLRLLNLNESTVVVRQPDQGPCGGAGAVAVSGTYAFVASRGCNDGTIAIYDVTNPASARRLREVRVQTGLAVKYTDLLSLNDEYLVAISPDRPNGVDYDIVVIDRRDVNNLRVVATLGVAGADLRKGRIAGSRLYAVDVLGNPGKLAVVDLENPAIPVLESLTTAPTIARSVEASTASFLIPGGASGLVLGTAADPTAPVWEGIQRTDGSVWDVALRGDVAYVANESGVIVLQGVIAPPSIVQGLLTMSSDGSMATVSGAPASVSGLAPLTMEIRASSGATVSGTAVATDGSFSALIPAASGEAVSVRATDGAGRTSEWVSVGVVPFSENQTEVAISKAQVNSDDRFRARRVEIEGRHMVISSAWSNDPNGIGNSDKVVIMNLANPLQPIYRQVLSGYGDIQDVAIHDGWAYVASAEQLRLLNLNEGTVVLRYPDNHPGGGAGSVAVGGGYAFVGSRTWNNGRIAIYDVANPGASRRLREIETQSGVFYSDLVVLDDRYMVGLTPSRPNGEEKDILILDRSDINNLRVVATLGIVGMDTRRGRMSGTLLYTTDVQGNHVAIVDLTNPVQPQLLSVTDTSYYARGVAGAGSRALVADGTSSVTYLDVSVPESPAVLGSEQVSGVAWDAAIQGDIAYVANERGILVLEGMGTPPSIESTLVSMSYDGSEATVTGQASSVRGRAPLTVDVRTSAGSTMSGVSVSADGGFTTSIPASSGETVSVRATDDLGRTTEWLDVGVTPFSATQTTVAITKAQVNNDDRFRARRVEVEGRHMVISSAWSNDPNGIGNSDKVVIMNLTNPMQPVYRQVLSGYGDIQDVAIHDGWAYVASAEQLRLLNLNEGTVGLRYPDSHPGGGTGSVAVGGGYAFVGSRTWGNGRIAIYDVANPAAARWLREIETQAGVIYSDLFVLDDRYMVGLTPNRPNGEERDVLILDRSDVNNLRVVATLGIVGMDTRRGRISGATLYATDVHGNHTAIVDLTNPLQPQLLSVTNTSYYARGISAAGSRVLVADGSSSVTYMDVSTPANPAVLGSEQVSGIAWDAAIQGDIAYIANEHGIVVLRGIGTPPTVTDTLMRVSYDGTTATVSGLAHSVRGHAPVVLELTTSGGQVVTSIPVAADGSFSSSVTAASGELISIDATDAAGRVSQWRGTVPFGNAVSSTTVTSAMANGDSKFRARRVAIEGQHLVVTGAYSADPQGIGDSNQLLIFDVTNPGAPVHRQSINTGAVIRKVGIADGWAYVSGWNRKLKILNLNEPTVAVRYPDQDLSCEGQTLTTDGDYVFVGTWCGDGRIDIYDVTDPAAGRRLRSVSLIPGAQWASLTVIDPQYLLGVVAYTNQMVVIDRSDLANLRVVATLVTESLNVGGGQLVGNHFYTVQGSPSVLVIIDLSDPLQPAVASTLSVSDCTARGITVTNELVAVVPGCSSLSFFDVADPSAPVSLGEQRTVGNAWGVVAGSDVLYAVTETKVDVISLSSNP